MLTNCESLHKPLDQFLWSRLRATLIYKNKRKHLEDILTACLFIKSKVIGSQEDLQPPHLWACLEHHEWIPSRRLGLRTSQKYGDYPYKVRQLLYKWVHHTWKVGTRALRVHSWIRSFYVFCPPATNTTLSVLWKLASRGRISRLTPAWFPYILQTKLQCVLQ